MIKPKSIHELTTECSRVGIGEECPFLEGVCDDCGFSLNKGGILFIIEELEKWIKYYKDKADFDAMFVIQDIHGNYKE